MLVGFFAATGLVLSMVGFYGVVTFLVAQRTQEIGVRMALGADKRRHSEVGDRAQLKADLWREPQVGLVAALSVTRVMSSLLYSIGPHDPVTLDCVTPLLIVVALVATFIPARSATRVDPIVALRCE